MEGVNACAAKLVMCLPGGGGALWLSGCLLPCMTKAFRFHILLSGGRRYATIYSLLELINILKWNLFHMNI